MNPFYSEIKADISNWWWYTILIFTKKIYSKLSLNYVAKSYLGKGIYNIGIGRAGWLDCHYGGKKLICGGFLPEYTVSNAKWFEKDGRFYLFSKKDKFGDDDKNQRITCADVTNHTRETWQFFKIIKKDYHKGYYILVFECIPILTKELRQHPHLKCFTELDRIFNNLVEDARKYCNCKQFIIK